ncbi:MULTISPECIES: hypothetical protein [unclassified Bacillus (in: firmicutes)]|uniref:hypothetical protein n=1 Tax=unclassified Bacillus (in: firmicutes) TaxID=185979 RepID=UPI0008E2A4AF|nr:MULTISPECIES: hypothetical protein [unclassified Bacillus (in: firmicutes)]SFI97773.1 hypothetical protein SAMN04488574_105253 [Bacillus sp. 71mf]SFS63573.1 hypothetical protein SAMN04488145_10265 [Bacillus sp. 103mf]
MKKMWSILGILLVMGIASYGLSKFFIHYASKPVGVASMPKVEDVDETKEVLQFIGTTHASYNNFLNYGKAEKYTDGDWDHFMKWFQEQENALKNFEKKVKNNQIKRDVKRSYETLKKGVTNRNIEYIVYAHRVYHDLDIILNKYTGETNIWGYTEFGNGKDVKIIEQVLQAP